MNRYVSHLLFNLGRGILCDWHIDELTGQKGSRERSSRKEIHSRESPAMEKAGSQRSSQSSYFLCPATRTTSSDRPLTCRKLPGRAIVRRSTCTLHNAGQVYSNYPISLLTANCWMVACPSDMIVRQLPIKAA